MMICKKLPHLVVYFALGLISVHSVYAQNKQRVAVFPFDDRTTANKDMNIGTKVADLLISKLTADGAYTVFDRQYVDTLLKEKNLKYDPNYDSAQAAKQGLMGTVDVVIAGQIVAFNASTTDSTKNKIYVKMVETDGAVNLKATARLISVEKGSVIAAPSAEKEQTAVLSTKRVYMADPKTGEGAGSSQNTDTEKALRKLVDEAADQVAKELSADVSKTAATLPPPVMVANSPITVSPGGVKEVSLGSGSVSGNGVKPTFVGVSDGMAYLDKGSVAGVKPGEKFRIRRSTDTGLKGPDGKPIVHHKDVCSLTVTDIEDNTSAGKCVAVAPGTGGIPKPGDDVVPVSN